MAVSQRTLRAVRVSQCCEPGGEVFSFLPVMKEAMMRRAYRHGILQCVGSTLGKRHQVMDFNEELFGDRSELFALATINFAAVTSQALPQGHNQRVTIIANRLLGLSARF